MKSAVEKTRDAELNFFSSCLPDFELYPALVKLFFDSPREWSDSRIASSTCSCRCFPPLSSCGESIPRTSIPFA